MPHKKKKIFTKDNSVKFLLLHGNSNATNADGETLQNVFVPVSKNYKPGTSLLMSNIAALCNSGENEELTEEPDLERIMGQFEDVETDSDDDDDDDDDDKKIEDLGSKIKCLTVKQKEQKSKLFEAKDEEFSDDNSDYFDVNSQFSDASENSFEIDFKGTAVEIDYGDCPENLKILNERFEKVLGEYDEDQIGALDDEEIGGLLSTDCERVQNLLDKEFPQNEGEPIELDPCDEEIKEKILNYAEDSEEEKVVEIVTEKPVEFDCESILSTYTNIYNHPAIIKEEKVKKIRVLRNPLKKNLTKSQLKTLESDTESDTDSDDNVSVSTQFNIRAKGETPEERRERKSLFKEAKRESRMLKKENKLAFKKEKKVQKAQNLHKQRTAGIKLL